MVDTLPQLLKFLLRKIIVERIRRCLWLATIANHIIKGLTIEDRLNTFINSICQWFQFIRKLFQIIILQVLTECICNLTTFRNITVHTQLEYNFLCVFFGNSILLPFIEKENLTNKEINISLGRTIVEICLDVLLQICHKRSISFRGYNGQFVHTMNFIWQYFRIHADTILVNTKSQTTTNFLSLLTYTIRLAK